MAPADLSLVSLFCAHVRTACLHSFLIHVVPQTYSLFAIDVAVREGGHAILVWTEGSKLLAPRCVSAVCQKVSQSSISDV